MENGVNGHITRLPYSELYDIVITNQHSTGTGYHYTMRACAHSRGLGMACLLPLFPCLQLQDITEPITTII